VAAPFAYVTNEGSGTVSVLDTASNTVVATVPVGFNPFGVAVNPAGTVVFVTNDIPFGGVPFGAVSVLDTASSTVVATVPVGSFTVGVAVNPAGTRVYVANEFSGTVSVLDTASNTVVATVTVGSWPVAFGLFIGPELPPSEPVPTLSEWGMILAALWVLALGAWRLRRPLHERQG
jgi:YVTN family beta-propeller protein